MSSRLSLPPPPADVELAPWPAAVRRLRCDGSRQQRRCVRARRRGARCPAGTCVRPCVSSSSIARRSIVECACAAAVSVTPTDTMAGWWTTTAPARSPFESPPARVNGPSVRSVRSVAGRSRGRVGQVGHVGQVGPVGQVGQVGRSVVLSFCRSVVPSGVRSARRSPALVRSPRESSVTKSRPSPLLALRESSVTLCRRRLAPSPGVGTRRSPPTGRALCHGRFTTETNGPEPFRHGRFATRSDGRGTGHRWGAGGCGGGRGAGGRGAGAQSRVGCAESARSPRHCWRADGADTDIDTDTTARSSMTHPWRRT